MKLSILNSLPLQIMTYLILAGQRFIKKEVKVYLYEKVRILKKKPKEKQAPNLGEYREWIAWNQRTK